MINEWYNYFVIQQRKKYGKINKIDKNAMIISRVALQYFHVSSYYSGVPNKYTSMLIYYKTYNFMTTEISFNFKKGDTK